MAGEWRTDSHPALICGTTGAGKTTTARALHYSYPGPSLFFDLDEEPDMGVEVRTVDELADALTAGEEQICFRTPTTTVDEPEEYEQVVRYLLRLGNELRGTDARMQFLTDEVQNVPEKWVQVAMKRLRKRNIKPVMMTQDPVSISKRIRTIARWNVWLSPPAPDMMDFLARSRYPEELLQELPKYDALVLDEKWQPVGRFRAPERYAVE